ncbi:MAG: hypothetical protein RRZ24_11695 [Clostridia bacterium]
MPGYLINNTTREEREQLVAESLSNISATCDECSVGIVEYPATQGIHLGAQPLI